MKNTMVYMYMLQKQFQCKSKRLETKVMFAWSYTTHTVFGQTVGMTKGKHQVPLHGHNDVDPGNDYTGYVQYGLDFIII